MQMTFRCDPALAAHLPRPVPARDALPAWLRDMPRQAHSDAHGASLRTVKHCPPFVDAMAHGAVLPLPCDVTVRGGTLSWEWDIPAPASGLHPRAPISFHVAEQVAGTPLHRPEQVAGQVIVKFNAFWTVELDPGWSLLAMHPANREDLPFRLLTGLVDSDLFHEVGILFPGIWLDPSFEGVLPRGMPVAQLVPVPRDPPALVFGTLDRGRYDALAASLLSREGVYRKGYRARRSRPGEQVAAEGVDVEP